MHFNYNNSYILSPVQFNLTLTECEEHCIDCDGSECFECDNVECGSDDTDCDAGVKWHLVDGKCTGMSVLSVG